MRVFITGGAGFIGSHLADALIARGDSVTILDNMSTGSAKNIAHLAEKITVHEGDIRDQALVEKLVNESDIVFHMAAALGVKNIMEHTIESIDRNFTGSEVVLNAATKFDKRLIIASTSEIYGKNPNQPLHEESDRVVGAPQKIRWTYSDAKALEEAVAHTLHRTHGLKVTTVRFFNTVGPRQTGQYGMVVPRFIQAALKNEDIIIYDDGSQSRVFCHVEDAVKAVLTLADTDSTNYVVNTANTGGFYIFLKTTKYFLFSAVSEGDLINIQGFTVPRTGSTYGTNPGESTDVDFETWINRPEGHYVVATGIAPGDGGGALVLNPNTAGYCNMIIIRSRFDDPTTGSTVRTSSYFGGTSTTEQNLGQWLNGYTTPYSGAGLLNTSRQTHFVLRIITRDMDSASNIRPDNV